MICAIILRSRWQTLRLISAPPLLFFPEGFIWQLEKENVCWTSLEELLHYRNCGSVCWFIVWLYCVAHIEMLHHHEAHWDVGRTSSSKMWHKINWKSKNEQHISPFSWKFQAFMLVIKFYKIFMLVIGKYIIVNPTSKVFSWKELEIMDSRENSDFCCDTWQDQRCVTTTSLNWSIMCIRCK